MGLEAEFARDRRQMASPDDARVQSVRQKSWLLEAQRTEAKEFLAGITAEECEMVATTLFMDACEARGFGQAATRAACFSEASFYLQLATLRTVQEQQASTDSV